MRSDLGAAADLVLGSRRGAGVFALVGLLAGSGCGTPDPDDRAQPAIVIQLSRHDLLIDAVRVAVYFYDASQSCAVLQAMDVRPPTTVGPFQAILSSMGRESGMTFSLDPIPAGAYSVLVDALDADGRRVASGCASDQMVKSRVTSKIRVQVSG